MRQCSEKIDGNFPYLKKDVNSHIEDQAGKNIQTQTNDNETTEYLRQKESLKSNQREGTYCHERITIRLTDFSSATIRS